MPFISSFFLCYLNNINTFDHLLIPTLEPVKMIFFTTYLLADLQLKTEKFAEYFLFYFL